MLIYFIFIVCSFTSSFHMWTLVAPILCSGQLKVFKKNAFALHCLYLLNGFAIYGSALKLKLDKSLRGVFDSAFIDLDSKKLQINVHLILIQFWHRSSNNFTPYNTFARNDKVDPNNKRNWKGVIGEGFLPSFSKATGKIFGWEAIWTNGDNLKIFTCVPHQYV